MVSLIDTTISQRQPEVACSHVGFVALSTTTVPGIPSVSYPKTTKRWQFYRNMLVVLLHHEKFGFTVVLGSIRDRKAEVLTTDHDA
jgi:hypothetical protein